MKNVFDTHAHLSMLDKRRIPSVQRVRELFAEGFAGIIDIGTRPDDLASRFAAYGTFNKVWFSAGIWPSKEAIENRFEGIRMLKAQIDKAPPGKVVAIGECGLDRHWNHEASGVNPEHEAELFSLQIELAEQLGLPVIIHSRDAPEETLAIMIKYPLVQFIVHCYSYGMAEVKQFLDQGAYISFAGTLTYKDAADIREALAACPQDRMFFETDCPYLAPVPHRGKPAEPGMTAVTCRFAADELKVDYSALKEQVLSNIRRVFKIEV